MLLDTPAVLMRQVLPLPVASLHCLGSSCRSCRNNTLCLPVAVDSDALFRLEAITESMKPVPAGSLVFSSGDTFVALYAIHSGSIKTCIHGEAGGQHITGFHLPGEITGIDGIATGIHTNDGVAMETTTVCRIPYRRLLPLMRKLPALQHHLMWLLGRRIAADFRILLALNTKCAVARVALMLVEFSQRFQARRFSASSYRLPMTRADIGSYLGLEIETVSRALSALHATGSVAITGREVRINDLALLARISRQTEKASA